LWTEGEKASFFRGEARKEDWERKVSVAAVEGRALRLLEMVVDGMVSSESVEWEERV
jgi:hypothetical protein